MFNRMCLGTFSVLYPVNLFFKLMFLLKSMALMVKMSNSLVYGLPQKNVLSLSLVGSTLIFGPASLDGKVTTKQSMLADQKSSMSGGQLSVFLKNSSKTFSEILHEARGS